VLAAERAAALAPGPTGVQHGFDVNTCVSVRDGRLAVEAERRLGSAAEGRQMVLRAHLVGAHVVGEGGGDHLTAPLVARGLVVVVDVRVGVQHVGLGQVPSTEDDMLAMRGARSR